MSTPSLAAKRSLYEMRDPLACVELAASQLLRSDSGPGARALAVRILDAVRDLDLRLHESIGALDPVRRDAHDRDDCRAALAALIDEIAPVLRARDREVAPFAEAEPSVSGDASFARRAALQLLRAGGRWAGPGGTLALALHAASGAYGIEVSAERANGCEAASEDAFRAAQRFALAEGAELVLRAGDDDPQRATATLWRRLAEAAA